MGSTIAWSEVLDIVPTNKVIVVKMHDPQKYLESSDAAIKKIRVTNNATYGSPVVFKMITFTRLTNPPKTEPLIDEVQRYRQAALL